LIVLLLWIYYSAQIFLLGAEFTKAYAARAGSRQPSVAPLPSTRPTSERSIVHGSATISPVLYLVIGVVLIGLMAQTTKPHH
jgi:membrane protein